MRTTIDMPDELWGRAKAIAAARGVTLKELIVNAVEREIKKPRTAEPGPRTPKLPLIHLGQGRVLDLTNFDFDDLIA